MKKKNIIILASIALLFILLFAFLYYDAQSRKTKPLGYNVVDLHSLDAYKTLGTLNGYWDIEGNPKYSQFELSLVGDYPRVIQFDFIPYYEDITTAKWGFAVQVMLPEEYWHCYTRYPKIVFSDGKEFRLYYPFHGKQRCRAMDNKGHLAINLSTSEDRETATAISNELIEDHYPVAVTNNYQKLLINTDDWAKVLRAFKVIINPRLDLNGYRHYQTDH